MFKKPQTKNQLNIVTVSNYQQFNFNNNHLRTLSKTMVSIVSYRSYRHIDTRIFKYTNIHITLRLRLEIYKVYHYATLTKCNWDTQK